MRKMSKKKRASKKVVPRTQRGYDIYELASALQKDIRREHEDRAMFWAVELESFNDKMLWNRLRIIASEDASIANPTLPLLIDVLEKQYCAFKKRPKDTAHRLFLAHAILLLCRSEKSRIANNLVLYIYGEIKFNNRKIPIPDYALDMHTAKGKAKGRGMKHFLEEGSKLRNVTIKDPYKKKAEEILLKHGEP